MYEAHYHLTTKPFSIVPNPNILFLSKNHTNALTYLEYGLSEKAGFILLTGEVGAGKTTLVRHMIDNIGQKFETAVIFNTNFSPDQLFRQILDEFEIPCDTTEKDRHLSKLYDFLIERYSARQNVLLIIDEAQNLTNETLENIRMLSNLQADDQNLIQIILVGQPELKERLKAPEFRQLAQRIAVNYHIRPLDKLQTVEYIGYRMQKAGGKADVFSRSAMEMVYQHSQGIPRTINLICDTALVYGFAENLMQIDETVIQKVLKDEICMAASTQNEPGKKDSGPVSNTTTSPEIIKRIRLLEMSIKKLKTHYENFTRRVNSDLIAKYEHLLAMEQRRYDQLLERYFQLQPRKGISDESAVADEGQECSEDCIGGQTGDGSPLKFAHLMDLVDAQKAVDKERTKMAELFKIEGEK